MHLDTKHQTTILKPLSHTTLQPTAIYLTNPHLTNPTLQTPLQPTTMPPQPTYTTLTNTLSSLHTQYKNLLWEFTTLVIYNNEPYPVHSPTTHNIRIQFSNYSKKPIVSAAKALDEELKVVYWGVLAFGNTYPPRAQLDVLQERYDVLFDAVERVKWALVGYFGVAYGEVGAVGSEDGWVGVP